MNGIVLVPYEVPYEWNNNDDSGRSRFRFTMLYCN